MTLADYSMTAFAIANGGRVLAYMPQIVRVCRDPNGAAAVSLVTWSLFTAANAATVVYALVGLHDLVVAAVFALNALGSLTIVGLTAFKRLTVRPVGLRWTRPRPGTDCARSNQRYCISKSKLGKSRIVVLHDGKRVFIVRPARQGPGG
jgi:hypothetical protein